MGGRVAAHPGDGDDVDGAVELAVAEAVEAVAVGAAGGHRDRGGAGEHAEGSFAVDPSGVGPGQQDLGGGQGAEAGFGGDQAGGHVLDDLGDLRLEPGSLFGEGGDALAEPDQGLVQDPGLPVRAGGAGQRGAFFRAPLAGERPEPFAQRGGGGDQDGGQRGAGGLGGLDGVVPVDHQQPQRFAVPVGAHLRRAGPGEQFAGRADGVDRVALARPALADVTAAVDLGHLLALAGQVAGQAQAVMPGPFHRPDGLPVPGSRPDPGQQLLVACRGGGHLQLGHGPAAGIADRRGMGVQVGVDPDDQVGVLG